MRRPTTAFTIDPNRLKSAPESRLATPSDSDCRDYAFLKKNDKILTRFCTATANVTAT
jgi:hypothetical protein